MHVKTKDGPWIYATRVLRIDCDKCGLVTTTKYPKNDREIDILLREHAREHGGVDR
jgi:hypothetical protein